MAEGIPDVAGALTRQVGEGLRVPEGGAEAMLRAGQHAQQEIRVLGSAAEDVYNTIQAHQELQENNGTNDFEGANYASTQDAWRQQIAKDPNTDPLQWWQDNVSPQWDKQQENVSTLGGQRHLAEVRSASRMAFLHEAVTQQRQMSIDTATASSNAIYDDAEKAVRDDPASLPIQAGLARVKVGGVLDAANVPAPLKAEHMREQDQRLGDAAVEAIAGKAELAQPGTDYDGILKVLRDPSSPYYQMSSPKGRDAAIERVEHAQATAGNIAAAVQDVQRPILLDQVAQGDPKAYDTLTQMAANPKGNTPEARAVYTAEVLRDRDEKHAFYEGSQTIYNMSDTEARHLVESMPLAPNAAQKGVIEAYKDREAGLNKDPVGWITQHNATANAAYQAWQQNPTADNWNKLAITQTAIQKRLRPDEPVHLLTPEIKAQAQGIVTAITQSPEGAAGASKQLFQMAEQYGGSWHSIAHDLMDEKVISREQYAAARLYGDPSRQAEGEKILSASAMKAGDRFDAHGIPEAKARKEAQAAMQPFIDSLGNVNDGGDVWGGFVDALTHVLQVSGDPNNLPTLARAEANKMLLSEYSFAGATHTIRVPANLDADAITRGTESVQNAIDQHNLVIPRNYGGMNAANHAENYKRTIMLTGRWYTDETGTGAKLYDQDGHNVMEIRNGRAVPVRIDFKELARIGTEPTQQNAAHERRSAMSAGEEQ